MKLNFDVNKDNIKEVSEKLEALGRLGTLRIYTLLKEKGMSLKEIDEILHKEGVYKHRESTYKALEKLVKLRLVKKSYNQEKKKIIYSSL